MKYRASDIVKRAYQLADITNTDFLRHEENIHYINDAWKQVYQWLINKGDKQFVKEVTIAGGGHNGYVEYDIPDDLYQIESIKDSSGFMIPRKATSQSDNSCTYEIVNDRIRLYGCPAGLTLTYWISPVWITYPDKDIDVGIPSGAYIHSTCHSSVLYEYEGYWYVFNAVEGNTVADVSWINDIADKTNIILGNGMICMGNRVYDFDGEVISNDILTAPIRIGDVIYNASYEEGTATILDIQSNPVRVIDSGFSVIGGNARSIIMHDDNLDLYRLDDDDDLHFLGNVGTMDLTLVDIDGSSFYLYNNQNKNDFYYFDSSDFYKVTSLFGSVRGITAYGPIVFNGKWIQKSGYEDTLFNFPNELYVSLLSADLAVRYAMKMNASVDGLNNLYEAMKNTFMNTLTQDGGYTRIQNIYRA